MVIEEFLESFKTAKAELKAEEREDGKFIEGLRSQHDLYEFISDEKKLKQLLDFIDGFFSNVKEAHDVLDLNAKMLEELQIGNRYLNDLKESLETVKTKISEKARK